MKGGNSTHFLQIKKTEFRRQEVSASCEAGLSLAEAAPRLIMTSQCLLLWPKDNPEEVSFSEIKMMQWHLLNRKYYCNQWCIFSLSNDWVENVMFLTNVYCQSRHLGISQNTSQIHFNEFLLVQWRTCSLGSGCALLACSSWQIIKLCALPCGCSKSTAQLLP